MTTPSSTAPPTGGATGAPRRHNAVEPRPARAVHRGALDTLSPAAP